jgi:hypothetical protein
VEAHAYPNRAGLQRLLRLSGRGYCVGAVCEGDEERVALRVDLDPTVAGECVTKNSPMLAQRLGIPFTQLVKELRRALDVGEQEKSPSRMVAAPFVDSSRAGPLPRGSRIYSEDGSLGGD